MQSIKKIKEIAKQAGADLVGIADVGVDDDQIQKLENFVADGRSGEMKYLNDVGRRTNLDFVLPGAKSVIVIAVNYYHEQRRDFLKDQASAQAGDDGTEAGDRQIFGIVARYAYGRDYHKVIKKILTRMIGELEKLYPEANFRACTDSAPLMEKYYAVKAGLGFIGKNTTLITKEYGSFVLLGEILTDLALVPDRENKGTCGTCTRCLNACPTKALIDAGVMDARKCISYLTIEYDGKITAELAKKMGSRIFGCDICQEVCPYNLVNSRPSANGELNRRIAGDELETAEILTIKTGEEFTKKFAGSPLMRTGKSNLQRNARIVRKNVTGC